MELLGTFALPAEPRAMTHGFYSKWAETAFFYIRIFARKTFVDTDVCVYNIVLLAQIKMKTVQPESAYITS